MTTTTPLPDTHPVPWRIATIGLAAAIGFGAGLAGDNILWNDGGGTADSPSTRSELRHPTFDESIRDAQATMTIPAGVARSLAVDASVTFDQSISDAQADMQIP